jgi:hypothetical protein
MRMLAGSQVMTAVQRELPVSRSADRGAYRPGAVSRVRLLAGVYANAVASNEGAKTICAVEVRVRIPLMPEAQAQPTTPPLHWGEDPLTQFIQIGVCTLECFWLVYRERFDIMGVKATVDELKQGLRELRFHL